MLGLLLSSKLDLGCYIVSIVKTASLHSMKFPLPKLLFNCMNLPYGLPWNTLVMWLVLPFPTQISQISYRNRYKGPLVLHLSPLNSWLIILLVFCRFSSELHELVTFLYIRGSSTRLSNRLHDVCHNPQMLQCLCQKFLSLHSQTLEFSVSNMLVGTFYVQGFLNSFPICFSPFSFSCNSALQWLFSLVWR